MSDQRKRQIYDQVGEEGLKGGGMPDAGGAGFPGGGFPGGGANFFSSKDGKPFMFFSSTGGPGGPGGFGRDPFEVC